MIKKAIFLQDERHRFTAEQLSVLEGIPITDSLDSFAPKEVALWINFDSEGVSIQGVGDYATKKVRVDFVSGALFRRSQHKHLHGEMIAKAIGLKKHPSPKVFDGTAGLARDSFILATLGCKVEMMEQSNIIACLVQDGLLRAREEGALEETLARMHFNQGDSLHYMLAQRSNEAVRPDVVYLDPMFPDRQKTALAKKEMRLFQLFCLEQESEIESLLGAGIQFAKRHVVIKRPLKADPLKGFNPSHAITGRSCRFDVYVAKSQ